MCIVFISTNLFCHKSAELLIYAILSIMPHKFEICKFDTISICMITSKVLRGNFPRSTLCYMLFDYIEYKFLRTAA